MQHNYATNATMHASRAGRVKSDELFSYSC